MVKYNRKLLVSLLVVEKEGYIIFKKWKKKLKVLIFIIIDWCFYFDRLWKYLEYGILRNILENLGILKIMEL